MRFENSLPRMGSSTNDRQTPNCAVFSGVIENSSLKKGTYMIANNIRNDSSMEIFKNLFVDNIFFRPKTVSVREGYATSSSADTNVKKHMLTAAA